MASIVCSGCDCSFSVGKESAGKRVMCAKCGEMIPVPRSLIYPDEKKVSDLDNSPWTPKWRESVGQLGHVFSDPKNFALIAFGMASLAILLICLPKAGFYVSMVLSGGGLLLSLIGMIKVLMGRGRGLPYLLGSSSVCILAGLLVMLPRIWR